MVHLTIDLGGRPGFDCRGFCEYCYFKHAKDVPPFGCRYCLPMLKGCDYCDKSVKEKYTRFIPLHDVSNNFLADLQLVDDDNISRINISGGGDPSCYPEFKELIELLGELGIPLHIGYTSGKGFDNPDIAEFLISHHLTEISFTVFASNPELRRNWMHDPTPEVSLEIIRRLASKITVYAAIVVIPDVNDGDILEDTISWLSQIGVKGVILMRFANSYEQGLILENSPIIPNQRIHSIPEFVELVKHFADLHPNIRITGTPLYDPKFGSPFAILNHPDLIAKLPKIKKKATIITGTVALPYIQSIISKLGGDPSSVVSVNKEISSLITIKDFDTISLSSLSDTVIIPGQAFVHDMEVETLLSKDGILRRIVRGLDILSVDGETSMGMIDESEVLTLEFENILNLVNLINQNGSD
ncbi:MAG TPA: methyl coenzyme M reductase-arginine methyltransferase Mmp10 [Methanocorpusculum sp.]|nr:methyl coenzyme M reductase-arginine methyltransferase Mmp10 [Methanocorpusculum sp.]